jgi:hypothetical protein
VLFRGDANIDSLWRYVPTPAPYVAIQLLVQLSHEVIAQQDIDGQFADGDIQYHARCCDFSRMRGVSEAICRHRRQLPRIPAIQLAEALADGVANRLTRPRTSSVV